MSHLGVLSAQLANAKPPIRRSGGCKRKAAVIFSAMTCSKFRWPRKPSFLLVGAGARCGGDCYDARSAASGNIAGLTICPGFGFAWLPSKTKVNCGWRGSGRRDRLPLGRDLSVGMVNSIGVGNSGRWPENQDDNQHNCTRRKFLPPIRTSPRLAASFFMSAVGSNREKNTPICAPSRDRTSLNSRIAGAPTLFPPFTCTRRRSRALFLPALTFTSIRESHDKLHRPRGQLRSTSVTLTRLVKCGAQS